MTTSTVCTDTNDNAQRIARSRKRNGEKPGFCVSKNVPIKESDCWKYWKTTKRRKVKKSLSEGKKIEVDIKSIYDFNNKRPKRFEVKSIINKKEIQEIKKYKFYN